MKISENQIEKLYFENCNKNKINVEHFFLILNKSGSESLPWNYEGNNRLILPTYTLIECTVWFTPKLLFLDSNNWNKVFDSCNGRYQSPINIDPSKAIKKSSPNLVFGNYDHSWPMNITNDGHTGKII